MGRKVWLCIIVALAIVLALAVTAAIWVGGLGKNAQPTEQDTTAQQQENLTEALPEQTQQQGEETQIPETEGTSQTPVVDVTTEPVDENTTVPTETPVTDPNTEETEAFTSAPTEAPTTEAPTEAPTEASTTAPTEAPTEAPITSEETVEETTEFDPVGDDILQPDQLPFF